MEGKRPIPWKRSLSHVVRVLYVYSDDDTRIAIWASQAHSSNVKSRTNQNNWICIFPNSHNINHQELES